MTNQTKNLTRFLALALPLVAAAWFSAAAVAAAPKNPIAGCDAQVLDAMNKKANAVVAYDVATTEGISDPANATAPLSGISKPDSVLALSCFNNAAGNASQNIGKMFSGDFTTGITPVIPDALTTWYQTFKGSIGNDSGTVPYTETSLGTGITTCTHMKDLWAQAKDKGTPVTPFPLFDDFYQGNEPNGLANVSGGKSNFHNDWTQSKTDNDFADFKTADDILKQSKPGGGGPVLAIPNFSTASPPTTCNMLALLNPPITCPP